MSDRIDSNWLEQYFEQYRRAIVDAAATDDLLKISQMWQDAASRGRKIIFAGNGGSAAISSHCSVDLTKTAGMRAINFNEADLITCLANDYGYTEWLAKAIEFYADPGDVAVLISSSGRSPNMIAAAHAARRKGLGIVTFTGFSADNPLRALGDINVWIDSDAYNVVEMTHHIWLLAVVDMQITIAEQRQGKPGPALSPQRV